MDPYILEAKGLTYTYPGEPAPALNNFSLQIKRGCRTVFLGSNGSGKSTFLLSCGGLLKPTDGTLSFNGTPYGYGRKDLLTLRQKTGLIFQDSDHQLFSADVAGDISFGPMNLGLPEEEVTARVTRIMEQLGITAFAGKPVHALSGGQKKQVAIAGILAMEPELVMLDEPFSALDPGHAAIVKYLIEAMSHRSITILIATHDVDYALAFADEIVLIDGGRVLASGPPLELFQNQTLLDQMNLPVPGVLKLFRSLQRRGVLSPTLAPPRTYETLHDYINCMEELQ